MEQLPYPRVLESAVNDSGRYHQSYITSQDSILKHIDPQSLLLSSGRGPRTPTPSGLAKLPLTVPFPNALGV